jgi:hypothetical protein
MRSGISCLTHDGCLVIFPLHCQPGGRWRDLSQPEFAPATGTGRMITWQGVVITVTL